MTVTSKDKRLTVILNIIYMDGVADNGKDRKAEVKELMLDIVSGEFKIVGAGNPDPELVRQIIDQHTKQLRNKINEL